MFKVNIIQTKSLSYSSESLNCESIKDRFLQTVEENLS
jgi:hypothetical protein